MKQKLYRDFLKVRSLDYFAHTHMISTKKQGKIREIVHASG